MGDTQDADLRHSQPRETEYVPLLKEARALLLRLPGLTAADLVRELIHVGMYRSEDVLIREWNKGRGSHPEDPPVTYEDFINSNRSFYVEYLGYLASGRAENCDEAWRIHSEELEKFTKEAQRRIAEGGAQREIDSALRRKQA